MCNDLDLEQKIIDFRRDLHRIPELGFDLPKTRAFLMSALEPLGFDIRDLGDAGFTVFIDHGKNETFAFRCDMDALEINEPEGCDFRSEHKGMMHACGHDGHMAMMLGLAYKCAEYKETLPKNALLVFQAAEETSGGAKMICDTGVLKDYGVSCIFGLHLRPKLTENMISCRAGEFMSGTSMLEVGIEGKSVHIADFRKGADALEAGCLFIERAYKLERELPTEAFRLLRFGEFNSGTAQNIVSGKTVISGTLRTFDEKTNYHIISGLERIMRDIEEETGTVFSYKNTEGYPPVFNPEDLYEFAYETLTEAGYAWRVPKVPYLYAEDFAFYQREVPGLYMHLCMGNEVRSHSPEFLINEKTLISGTELMWTLLTKEKRI